MKITRICAIDSMYTLLQYLLLSTEDDIKGTFFFWRNGVSDSIKHYFNNQSAEIKKQLTFLDMLWLYYIIYPLKYPFIRKSGIKRYSCDNLGFEHLVIRKYDFNLLEDGLLDYVDSYPFRWKNKRFASLKRYLFGPIFSERKRVGTEQTCKCIHLTGLVEKAQIYSDPKVVVDRLDDLWNNSSKNKRDLINKAYRIDNDLIKSIKGKKQILITQPWSEDKYLSEEEKIQLYSNIINKYCRESSVVIKPHPRETTDYSRIFPNCYVLKSKAPMQLLSFNGLKFTEAYTVCSTAVFDFPYPIKVGYLGTDIHTMLSKRIPNGLRCNMMKAGKNVSLIEL